jgi:hypothetical protein
MKVKDWIQASPRDDAGFPISDRRQDWKFSKGERNCRWYKGRLPLNGQVSFLAKEWCSMANESSSRWHRLESFSYLFYRFYMLKRAVARLAGNPLKYLSFV